MYLDASEHKNCIAPLYSYLFANRRTIFFLAIGLAVGLSVMLMMALKITHPPAGGNTIVVMLTQDSFQFLIFPIMVGAATIVIGGIIYNRFILKKNYPLKWF